MASEDLPRLTAPNPKLPRHGWWPERLAVLIEDCRLVPFAWGTQDCCTLAADAVVATTGIDIFARWRGKYTTEAEADALIGPAGLDGAALALMAEWGAPLCMPATAQRGDIALVAVGNALLLGVVVGDRIAAPGPDGLVFLKIDTARRVWAI